MANQSGTLASTQGALILPSSANDLLTVTVSSGTFSVEYPLGTLAITAATSTQSLAMNGGNFRLVVTAGSVSWALTDGAQGDNLTVSADRNLTAADDQKTITCTAVLTLTIPSGLSPRPVAVVIPPASGNVSVAVSGSATTNGATTTLTRSRSSNPAGFAIMPYVDVADGYGVNGS